MSSVTGPEWRPVHKELLKYVPLVPEVDVEIDIGTPSKRFKTLHGQEIKTTHITSGSISSSGLNSQIVTADLIEANSVHSQTYYGDVIYSTEASFVINNLVSNGSGAIGTVRVRSLDGTPQIAFYIRDEEPPTGAIYNNGPDSNYYSMGAYWDSGWKASSSATAFVMCKENDALVFRAANNLFATGQSVEWKDSLRLESTGRITNVNQMQCLSTMHARGGIYIGPDEPPSWSPSVLSIQNVAEPPEAREDCGIVYVEGGALKFRGAGGTVTVLAPS